jgi:hypothetical protein
MAEQDILSQSTCTNNEASATIEKYRVVCADPSDNEGGKLPTAGTDPVIGISQVKALATETLPIAYAGISYVTAAGVIARGATLIISGTVGKVAAKGTGANASGTKIIGTAIKAAGADGDIIPALLTIGSEISS